MKSKANFMRTHWEEQVETYAQRRRPSPVDNLFLKLLGSRAPEPVLELGCGPGVFAAAFTQAYPERGYLGLDFAGNFIETARKNPRHASWVVADVVRLPFKTASCPIVVEMNTIHHFNQDLLPAAVQEVARIMTSGGDFILAEDWALLPQEERDSLAYSLQARRLLTREGHEYHPTEAEWRRILTDAGFQISSREPINRPLDFAQFAELEDPASLRELAALRRLWGEEIPTTQMLVLQCRKG